MLIVHGGSSAQIAEDIPMAVKPQQKKKKRTQVDKRTGTGDKTRNRKPGFVKKEKAQSAIGSFSPGTAPDSQPPLKSQEGSFLEEPLLQHQSQIFVFSTQLANEAAESVKCGQCKSIIHYHMEHPNTKQFMQNSNNYGCSIPPVPAEIRRSQQMADMIQVTSSAAVGWRPHTSEMPDSRMFDRSRMLPNGSFSSEPKVINNCPGNDLRGAHPYVNYAVNCRECIPNSVDGVNDHSLGCPHNSSDKFALHVPDDNLTTEQKYHRSQGLAQLTKIHQMLMGDGSCHDEGKACMGENCHSPGSGVYTGGASLTNLSHQPSMMSDPEIMHCRGHMAPHHQHMLMPSAHGGYAGQAPFYMGGKGQQSAQDWYHAQGEFLEKQQYLQNRGNLMEHGLPPPYYSARSCQQSTVSVPSSPNMNGMGILTHPHSSHEVMLPGMDHDRAGMYADGAGMYRSPTMYRQPHLETDLMLRMQDYHSLQRPMVFECDSLLAQESPPGIGPGPDSSRPHGSVHKRRTVNYSEMMPDMKVTDEGMLYRAGNPEHFNPETMGGVVTPVTTPSSSSNKSPANYAQTQKRKREEDKDDSYAKGGNLQRTPSPTTIDYHLSQFEGQELTITKQLNSSFMDDTTENFTSEEISFSNLLSGNNECHFNSPADSPSAVVDSKKGSHSNLHQDSFNTRGSPAALPAKPVHHRSQQDLANAQCTSFSPPAFGCGTNSQLSQCDSIDLTDGVSGGIQTSFEKSTATTNITSTSLANLAKGVEHLSSQMEQNLMNGGPFNRLQVQGEITGNSSSGNTRRHSSSSTANIYPSATSESSSYSSFLSFPTGPTMSTQSSSALNVNTYLTTQTSVANSNSMNSCVDMQRQNNSTEFMQTHTQPCSTQLTTGQHLESGMLRDSSVTGISQHINQFQGTTNSMTSMPGGSHATCFGPSGSSGLNGTGLFSQQPQSSSCILSTSPVLPKVQYTSAPLSNPQNNGSGSCAMPVVDSSSVVNMPTCNSSVQIQKKGQSTIQYLPAKPPSSKKSAASAKCGLDQKIPESASRVHKVDGKHSSRQNFANPSLVGPSSPMMSRDLLSPTALGPEFANQAAIAMHQSASMMRSSSMSDLDTINRNRHVAPLTKMEFMMAPNNLHHGIDSFNGNNPLMACPDSLMQMASPCHMKSRRSSRSTLSFPEGIVSGNLECVSPVGDMEGCLNTGPSMEEAQAQAQAHAAMMMQENAQMTASSPHGWMVPRGGPSPHMTVTGPMLGIPMHAPMVQHGIPTSSALESLMFRQYPYRPSVSAHSPHADVYRYMPGFSNEPMLNSVRGRFPHESVHRLSSQNFIAGPLLPRMPVGYMYGQMPSSNFYRHPGMEHLSAQYGVQYPGYQEDFYCPGPLQDHCQQISGVMGGSRQPY